MITYWGIHATSNVPICKRDKQGNTLDHDVFRVPCDKAHTNILIKAFTNYRCFLNNKPNDGIPENDRFKRILVLVDLYLQELKESLNATPADCIDSDEIAVPDSGEDSLDNFHNVLPKIFYLLYQLKKENKNLDTKKLFRDYYTLKKSTDAIIQEIRGDDQKSSDKYEPILTAVNKLNNMIMAKFPSYTPPKPSAPKPTGPKPVTKGGAYSQDSLDEFYNKQKAWNNAEKEFMNVPDNYKEALPQPGPSPFLEMFFKIFKQFIDDNADDTYIHEAREAVGMLSSEDLDEIMDENGTASENEKIQNILEYLKEYYKKALPHVNENWIPIIIKADITAMFVEPR
jgi:hypothetical protein